MVEPLDTVSDVEDWLSDEPEVAEVEEMLEAERDGPNRVTAIEALQDYLPEDEAEEPEPEGKRYRVTYPHLDRQVGDTLWLDPADYDTGVLLQDGRIEHNPPEDGYD